MPYQYHASHWHVIKTFDSDADPDHDPDSGISKIILTNAG